MQKRHNKIHLVIMAIIFVSVGIAAAITFNTVMADRQAAEIAKQEQAKIAAEEVAAAAILAESNVKLAEIVDNLSESYGTKVGAVVIDLSNGATATANAGQQFVSASIYKLFVAYGIYKEIDTGSISLDDIINSNGTYRTVEACLNLMITISDNECGYSLGKLYGWSNLDSLIASNKYSGTVLDNYDSDGNLTTDKHTTASDVALLLQRLYNGELLSEDSTNSFLTLLKANELNDWLPSGLPDGTIIAHKTGALYGYVHDAGIIYGTNKDTIVLLLTGEWEYPESEALPVFNSLANSVWNYMNKID